MIGPGSDKKCYWLKYKSLMKFTANFNNYKFCCITKYRSRDVKLCSSGIIHKVSTIISSPSFGFCIIKILEYKWQSSFIMYSLLLPPPLDPSIKMEVSSLGQSAHRARQITHYQEPYNPSNPSSKLQSTKYK